MVILMDGAGKVQASYLGTDPPTASLVNTKMKELNYDEMEEEHQDLLRIIRQTHGENCVCRALVGLFSQIGAQQMGLISGCHFGCQ